MTGKELRDKRKQLDLTQEQFAKELSVAPNTVARWERDEMAIPAFLHLAVESIERKMQEAFPTGRPPKAKSEK